MRAARLAHAAVCCRRPTPMPVRSLTTPQPPRAAVPSRRRFFSAASRRGPFFPTRLLPGPGVKHRGPHESGVALRRRPGSGVTSVGRKRAEAGRERAPRRDSQQLPPPARVYGGKPFRGGLRGPHEAVHEGFRLVPPAPPNLEGDDNEAAPRRAPELWGAASRARSGSPSKCWRHCVTALSCDSAYASVSAGGTLAASSCCADARTKGG